MLKPTAISGAYHLSKRMVDVLVATLSLAMFAVPMALIAVAIRLDSPGPALFRQDRIGLNNRAFRMLKFRTMRVQPAASGTILQATRRDGRVTRVGSFLRRTSLDELPQLLNVLRGQMSLVGPRPHAPGTEAGGRRFEDVTSRYAARHCVRPGLTGLAQIRGLRGETDTEEKLIWRVESDLEYIENWSLWQDLLILARTVFSVARMTNAY